MAKLLGEQLKQDKRVRKAKALLKTALADYQKGFKGVRPADSKRKDGYRKMLEQCSSLRGGKLYYPYLSTGLGKGPLVELGDGSVKYDFITGIGVHYFGHSNPKLLESSVDAALEDTLTQGNLQQSTSSVKLMELLVQGACRTGAKLNHCFLTSSGAMANENALKMIFQKRAPASRVLAFNRCFAGRSLAAGQITDKPENRDGLPKVLDVDYIPFFDAADPQGSTRKAVETLNSHLLRHPGQYAAMMFELIQGEGGYYGGDRNFFIALMEVLKINKIAVFIDEIQTFGRTTELFAFQYYGLEKYIDVVSVGKLTQACATLFSDEYVPRPNLISQTFTATSSAVHAAIVILNELMKGKYLGAGGKIAQYHERFVSQLRNLSQTYPDWIKGPFGVGAMVGVTVHDGSAEVSKLFLTELFENGVISFIAGKSPYRVRFLMPIGAVTPKDIDNVCRIIEQTIKSVKEKYKKG